MGINHVIRGADHLANTSKQILILKALGWEIPQYAHLPLILGQDKKRLSKRHGATSVNEFREKGYIPAALFNYLCLLGWSPGDDHEIFEKSDLIKTFSLEKVNNSNAIFDQEKLKWMNAKYISDLATAELIQLSKLCQSKNTKLSETEVHSLIKLADLVKIRAETMDEFDQKIHFFYDAPESFNQKGVQKYFNGKSMRWLDQLSTIFSAEKDFVVTKIEKLIRKYAEDEQVSAGTLIHPLRLALTGDIASPGIFEIVEILGKDKVINRINKAVRYIETNIKVSTN
jgi:glutamyl-tRNA synthetase